MLLYLPVILYNEKVFKGEHDGEGQHAAEEPLKR